MAIYHFSQKIASRSSGRNAVATGAYICGLALYDQRLKDERGQPLLYRFADSDRVAHRDLLLPEGVDTTVAAYCDLLERFEDALIEQRFRSPLVILDKKACAAVFMTVEMALPKELDLSQQKALCHDFLKGRFADAGHGVVWAIHKDEGNPHVHALIGLRPFVKGELSAVKDRYFPSKTGLLETRHQWAMYANKALENAGIDERIDARSYQDQGLALEGGIHDGWYARWSHAKGKESDRVQENAAIQARNQQKIRQDPSLILQEMSLKKAVFSDGDLDRLLLKRMAGQPVDVVTSVRERLLEAQDLVRLPARSDGVWYTSTYYQAQEKKFEAAVDSLNAAAGFGVPKERLDLVLESGPLTYNTEQKSAISHLTSESALSVLVGAAGTGKSTVLKAVVQAYEGEGRRVFGAALAGKMASQLGQETGIESVTLASLIHRWNALEKMKHWRGRGRLIFQQATQRDVKKGDILMIDELGMVDVRTLHQVLGRAQRFGFKVIGVGDPRQLPAIQAGDGLGMMLDKVGAQTLRHVYRQKTNWMKEASDLFRERPQEALWMYAENGRVIEGDHRSLVHKTMVQDYLRSTLPFSEKLLMAATNEEVASLNQGVRQVLKDRGLLGASSLMIKGQDFAERDRVMFLENTRDLKILGPSSAPTKVMNGQMGTVDAVEEKRSWNPFSKKTSWVMKVALDDGRTVEVTPQIYDKMTHGYAMTIHKSQGMTVDLSFVYANRSLTSALTYVGMTRHRQDARLYYSKDVFQNEREMIHQVSRISIKERVSDYHLSEESRPYYEQVQAYQWGVRAQMKVVQQLRALEKKEALGFEKMGTHLKEQQQTLWGQYGAWDTKLKEGAALMVKDWEKTKRFAGQAYLQKEHLEIKAGLHPGFRTGQEKDVLDALKVYQEASQKTQAAYGGLKDPTQKVSYDVFKACQQARGEAAFKVVSEQDERLVKKLCFQEKISWKGLNGQADRFMESVFTKDEKRSWETEIVETVSAPSSSPVSNQNASVLGRYFTSQSPSLVDRPSLTTALKTHVEGVVREVLGDPQHARGDQWRFGHKGSLVVTMGGEKAGQFYDFEHGVGGGILKLIAHAKGIDEDRAKEFAKGWLGWDRTHSNALKTPSQGIKPSPNIPKEKAVLDKKECVLVPENAPVFDLKTSQYRNLAQHYHEVARYEYQNETGAVLGYVLRLENEKGEKMTPPLSLWQTEKGDLQWQLKAWSSDQKSLYGLEKLQAKPDALVMVVEGEKTKDAGQDLFPEAVVLTWMGGASNVHKTDWSPLKGREVVVLPDHDEAGYKAALAVHDHLKDMSAVGVVDLPAGLPLKYDVADGVHPALPLTELQALVKEARYQRQGEVPALCAEKINTLHQQDALEKEAKIQSTLYQQSRFDEMKEALMAKTSYHVMEPDAYLQDLLRAQVQSHLEAQKIEGALKNHEPVPSCEALRPSKMDIQQHLEPLQRKVKTMNIKAPLDRMMMTSLVMERSFKGQDLEKISQNELHHEMEGLKTQQGTKDLKVSYQTVQKLHQDTQQRTLQHERQKDQTRGWER